MADYEDFLPTYLNYFRDMNATTRAIDYSTLVLYLSDGTRNKKNGMVHFLSMGSAFQCGSEIDYQKLVKSWSFDYQQILDMTIIERTPPNYRFISFLHLMAKHYINKHIYLEGKILIMTASLFEQCRVVELDAILELLLGPDKKANQEKMAKVLPFCHRGQLMTESDNAMRSYLQHFDMRRQSVEVMRLEPNVQIYFQNKSIHNSPRQISVNALVSLDHFLDLCGDSTKEETPESLQLLLKGNGKVRTGFFVYAKDNSLARLGCKNGDLIIIDEEDPCWNKVGPDLLQAHICFGNGMHAWMLNAINSLVDCTKGIRTDQPPHISLREVIRFWSEAHTGRLRFLSADTQVMCAIFEGINYFDGFSRLAKKHLNLSQTASEGLEFEGIHGAKMCVLTAGLIEQAMFTDIKNLVQCYTLSQRVDEEVMRDKHQYLYDAYNATKSQNDLRLYVEDMETEAWSKRVKSASSLVSTHLFDVGTGSKYTLKVNPFITFNSLMGLFTNLSQLSYESPRITLEGTIICFNDFREHTLAQLGIKQCSVISIQDFPGLKPSISPELSGGSSGELAEGFLDRTVDLVTREVKKSLDSMDPDLTEFWEEDKIILSSLSYFLLQSGDEKVLTVDTVDLFEGNGPYDTLYESAGKLLEKDYFKAKVFFLTAAFIQECQVSRVDDVIRYLMSFDFTNPAFSKKTMQKAVPICHMHFAVMTSPDKLRKYLQTLDLDQLRNDIRLMEPRIDVIFSIRTKGTELKFMTNVNSLISFSHFAKKYAKKCGLSMQSILISHNGKRLFISSSGKKTLSQLGAKDDDLIEVEDIDSYYGDSRAKAQCKGKNGAKSNKKKNRRKTEQKKKSRALITIPQTEEELRKEHSKMLSPVLEEAERKKLRSIRQKLNNLAIKNTRPKERDTTTQRNLTPGTVFNPPTEGLEGKAGKVVYNVVVGNVEHLYKSSKKSAKAQRNQAVHTIDLHACCADEATEKLNTELIVWIDVAMTNETFTIPVDILCGGGNQILAEIVEKWIRKKRQVANRPKGFP